ncbi:hypothetical protein [Companilactobacillus jidongensis]|uniref:hypothetical protein n=1 Tax=Companilactobacillus jidongensis TaxID=2486006 RepID=UPI0013DE2DC1|nr:hypothetical protein [Companilactobacillus jidongensis]
MKPIPDAIIPVPIKILFEILPISAIESGLKISIAIDIGVINIAALSSDTFVIFVK